MRGHPAKLVKEWLAGQCDGIAVFHLPSYAPELNPDEHLNCGLKAGVHSGPPARNRDQLKSKTLSHLRRLQKRPQRTAAYFKHPKIAYAA